MKIYLTQTQLMIRHDFLLDNIYPKQLTYDYYDHISLQYTIQYIINQKRFATTTFTNHNYKFCKQNLNTHILQIIHPNMTDIY